VVDALWVFHHAGFFCSWRKTLPSLGVLKMLGPNLAQQIAQAATVFIGNEQAANSHPRPWSCLRNVPTAGIMAEVASVGGGSSSLKILNVEV
jgi:hypothetical protein